jgi:formylglycine-generating enzyme required for sulfatase activity
MSNVVGLGGPWGERAPVAALANLDFVCDGLRDVAAGAAGASAFGCRQMVGNVWKKVDTGFRKRTCSQNNEAARACSAIDQIFDERRYSDREPDHDQNGDRHFQVH